MPSLVEIDPVVLEKKILKVVNLFLLFPNYLPFGKGVAITVSYANANGIMQTCGASNYFEWNGKSSTVAFILGWIMKENGETGHRCIFATQGFSGCGAEKKWLAKVT